MASIIFLLDRASIDTRCVSTILEKQDPKGEKMVSSALSPAPLLLLPFPLSLCNSVGQSGSEPLQWLNLGCAELLSWQILGPLSVLSIDASLAGSHEALVCRDGLGRLCWLSHGHSRLGPRPACSAASAG